MRSIVISPLLALGVFSAAQAGDTLRDLGAHEHGVGKLNIAFERDRIAMEFEAPGADIVGFEHAADSATDRQKVDEAIAALAKPLELFRLPADAKCQANMASVELHGGGEDGHAEEHADAHEHAEEHAGEAEGHTEFHATYVLSCAEPDAAVQIDFAYFTLFPNAKELEVQIISDKGSTAFEVTRDSPRLDLSDMI